MRLGEGECIFQGLSTLCMRATSECCRPAFAWCCETRCWLALQTGFVQAGLFGTLHTVLSTGNRLRTQHWSHFHLLLFTCLERLNCLASRCRTEHKHMKITDVRRRGLLSAALKTKGLAETDGCFELSVGNPDKGLLPLDEIKRRVAQFVEQGLPLVVTQVHCLPHGNIYHQGCNAEAHDHCSAWDSCNVQAPGASNRIAVSAACLHSHNGRAASLLMQALMLYTGPAIHHKV